MSVKFQTTAACLSVIAVLILSGCSTENVEAKSDSGKVVLSVPDSNPYKADITEAFNEAKSPFVRKVLADGVVTEAEYAESESQTVTCYEKMGMKLTVAKTGVAPMFHIEPIEGRTLKDEEMEKGDAECESLGHAQIAGVRGMLKFNPDKKNGVEMMLKCFKKRGVVEAGVTLKEFEPMYEDGDYMDAHRKDFYECDADPNFYNQ